MMVKSLAKHLSKTLQYNEKDEEFRVKIKMREQGEGKTAPREGGQGGQLGRWQ